jgi:hypothetical protein
MSTKQTAKLLVPIASLVVVAATTVLMSSSHVQAQNTVNIDDPRVQRGFAIAPVRLNLAGKNQALVGLGSYLVNAVADCNGCHSAGPQTEYTQNGNPYLLPPVFGGTKQVNPVTYLGGGNDFGPLVPGSPDIVSRNLTPDKSGLPEGGHTFAEFRQIIKTGVDMDHLHPNCPPPPPNASTTTGCLPFPFNGDLLQIMPWPAFQDMSDLDLLAIYEYLKTVPCIAGPPAPSPLHNDCP